MPPCRPIIDAMKRKIVFAPDSFKNALRAGEVGTALAEGWRSCRPGDELVICPLADGGEGTAAALVAARNGRWHRAMAHDPLMRPISGAFGTAGSLGILEMAEASGLERLKPDELDPQRATTFGAGELLFALLELPVSEIVLGIGGSATVDGGAGMLQALGAEFFDARGDRIAPGIGGGELQRIAAVDLSAITSRLAGRKLRVACDVDNPLLGVRGAAQVFGPQKGASPEVVAVLEKNLSHWSQLLISAGIADDACHPGDGAAGGLGFALRTALGAEITSGAKLVIGCSGLLEAMRNAALVVTGEGRTDGQTAGGKLCAEVAKAAAAAGVPVALCSGAIVGGDDGVRQLFNAAISIASGPSSLEEAIAATRINLRRTGAALAGIFSAGETDGSTR